MVDALSGSRPAPGEGCSNSNSLKNTLAPPGLQKAADHRRGDAPAAGQFAALIEGLDWSRVHVPRIIRPKATR
jgi:hypothetical protein